MYNLTHIKRLYKEMQVSAFDYAFFLLSNDLWFLSFHNFQNTHSETNLQTFCFSPTKEPCHLKRISTTELAIIHRTLNKENTKLHNALVLAQCRKAQSTDPLSTLQRKHQFTKDTPLLQSIQSKNIFSRSFQCQKKKIVITVIFQLKKV